MSNLLRNWSQGCSKGSKKGRQKEEDEQWATWTKSMVEQDSSLFYKGPLDCILCLSVATTQDKWPGLLWSLPHSHELRAFGEWEEGHKQPSQLFALCPRGQSGSSSQKTGHQRWIVGIGDWIHTKKKRKKRKVKRKKARSEQRNG